MNQPALLQHLPLGEYHLGSDIDHLGSANHTSFAGANADPLLRDGSLAQSATSSYSLPPSNEARYLPHRTAAANGVYSCQTGQGFSASPGDSGSGSFSTSPSSASSIAFPTFNAPQPGLTSTNNYSTYPQIYSNPLNYTQPSHLMYNVRPRMQSMTDHPSSGMLPSTRSPGSNVPVTPPLGATPRDNYTTTTHLSRHTLSPRSHNEPLSHSSYNTPRSAFPNSTSTMSLSPSSVSPFPSSASLHPGNYAGAQESRSPPFPTLQMIHDITSDGQPITADIQAKIEKGFFYSSDRTWTCYRRNYFSVNCSYTLNPHLPNRPLYLNRGGKNGAEQIQALAMSLSAAVDSEKGKSIELLQQTPKRDKGPQLQISIQKVAPASPTKTLHGPSGVLPDPTQMHTAFSPYAFGHPHSTQVAPPYLPLQSEPDDHPQAPSPTSASNASYPPSTHAGSSSVPSSSQSSVPVTQSNPSSQSHTFERIQFKSATANNGKRRAAQQYYTLIVELYADVRDINRSGSRPEWVKIAQRISAQVVVRGRSPSHYQEQGGGSAGAAPGGSGGSSGSRGLGGPGSGNTTAGASMGGFSKGWASVPGLGGGSNSGVGFRSAGFPFEPSPSTSHSVSSTSSMEGGAVGEPSALAGAQPQVDTQMQGTMDSDIESYAGYRYYPAPLYEGLSSGVKVEAGLTAEERTSSIKEELGHNMPMKTGPGRFHGVEGSKGWYPDFYAMSGY